VSKPTLVLLPGMDGTGLLFDPFVVALASEFDIKVVSYPLSDPLGYSELGALVRAALPSKGPYVILGESFSGPIAVALAASRPAQLKGLILCCSFVRNPRPAFAPMRSLIDMLPLGLAPLAPLSHMLLGRFSTHEHRAGLALALRQVSTPTLRARLKAVVAVDVAQEMMRINVPVLYLRAAHDRLVPATASALVLTLNPRVEMVELNAPHFLLQTAPAAAARVTAAFIRRTLQAHAYP
jgi:pimeloyl-ACP methyl ester carboxylesterase